MVGRHLGVLGFPISGSKSPAIHAAAYRELGLNWEYARYEVNTEDFYHFVEDHSELSAMSLTMPLKSVGYEYALGHGGRIDHVASQLQSVNTIVRDQAKLLAYNTDAYGVTEALRTAEVPQPSTLAILGSGATSRSVLLGAHTYFKGFDRVTVFSRNSDAAAATLRLLNDIAPGVEGQWLPLEAAADFGGADLTCNTLPTEVASQIEVDVPFSDGWMFDVNYSPWPSQLSLGWPEQNRISGLEMLLNQALAQVRIFVNGDPRQELPNEGHVFAAMRAACS